MLPVPRWARYAEGLAFELAVKESMNHLRTADGVEICYWIHRCRDGPSSAVLLIHGAASNHTRWSEFTRRTKLRDSYDLVLPDMRGNARSMCRGRIDLGKWCEDLLAILDAEGYETVIAVGHSLGAQIALHFAAAHPQRVRALALIDPVVRQALTGKPKRLKTMEPLVRFGISILRMLNRVGLQRRQFPLMDLEALDAETREAMQDDQPQEVLVRRYSATGLILKHMPIANYLQQLVASISPLPELERIDVPTLVLESIGADNMDRARSRAELTRLQSVELVKIQATHWPLTERPEEVRQAIENWIERLPPSAQD
jgi:pimeloyl-ACP methyl ester carboxylesterase